MRSSLGAHRPPLAPCRAEPAAAPGEDGADGEGRRNYKLTLAYDGTEYHGWQLQPGRRPTVQGALEAALSRFAGVPRGELKTQAAGRTDAGVHARGQVVGFYTPPGARLLEPGRMLRALNAALPQDIRITAAAHVPLDFNPRFALEKTYHYTLSTEPVPDPFTARFRAAPRRGADLDLAAMEAAAAALLGTHDFSAFSSLPRDGSARSPVKTLYALRPEHVPGGVRWVVTGDGFLYRQVRHMLGALLAVGAGSLDAGAVADALAAGPGRTPAQRHAFRGWMVAEARGLCLHEAVYPPHDDPGVLMYGPGGGALRRGVTDKRGLYLSAAGGSGGD